MLEMIEQQLFLDAVTNEFGFKPVILSSRDRFRWVVLDREGIGPEMIRIERRLQELTGKPIELRLLTKKDKNKRFDRNYLRGVEKI